MTNISEKHKGYSPATANLKCSLESRHQVEKTTENKASNNVLRHLCRDSLLLEHSPKETKHVLPHPRVLHWFD